MLTVIANGSKVQVAVYHKLLNGVTPTSSTLKFFVGGSVSPYWTQIGGDVDLLTAGAVVGGLTGLYGYELDTSSYADGQYLMHLSWEYDGVTYTATEEFTIQSFSGTSAAQISDIKGSITSAVNRIPVAANGMIFAIAQTIGAVDKTGMEPYWNKEVLANINKSASLADTMKTSNINDTVISAKKEAKSTGRRVARNLDYFKSVTLPELKAQIENTVKSLRSEIINDVKSENIAKKQDLANAFDIHTGDLVTLFERFEDVVENQQMMMQVLQQLGQQIPQQVTGAMAGMIGQQAQQFAQQAMRSPQQPQQGQPQQQQQL